MRRYFNIFLLEFQVAFAIKSLSLVWFLSALLGPLLMLAFWSSATASQGGSVLGWTFSNLATYYLLIVLGGSLFLAHIEFGLARDINRGDTTIYLLKPRPFFLLMFLHEIPWRLIQGLFTIIAILGIAYFTRNIIQVTDSPIHLMLALLMILLAYMMSFTFKMCVGLLAFWFTDASGIIQLDDFIVTICGGVIAPLIFIPLQFRLFLEVLPFAYILYYPAVALLGKLNYETELRVITVQLLWLIVFSILYRFFWRAGIKKFTAFGR
ncbi:MAG TPA: ABC-2 family transporter protein [Candidatus Levybacteria bacterium]|nr:ABC-2 family transporter protein [Candidatus Levybacteria bacterium]